MTMSTPDFCQWTEDADGIWESDCGQEFEFTHSHNIFDYCPYCGKKMEAVKFTPPPTREEIEDERGDRAYQEMKDSEI